MWFLAKTSGWTTWGDASKSDWSQSSIIAFKDSKKSLSTISAMNLHQNLWKNCKEGKLREARQALEAGTDPNTTGDRNMTCLMVAAENNHDQVVALLLAQPGIQVKPSIFTPWFGFVIALAWHPGEREGQDELYSFALGLSDGQCGQPHHPAGCSGAPAQWEEQWRVDSYPRSNILWQDWSCPPHGTGEGGGPGR